MKPALEDLFLGVPVLRVHLDLHPIVDDGRRQRSDQTGCVGVGCRHDDIGGGNVHSPRARGLVVGEPGEEPAAGTRLPEPARS